MKLKAEAHVSFESLGGVHSAYRMTIKRAHDMNDDKALGIEVTLYHDERIIGRAHEPFGQWSKMFHMLSNS